MVLPRLLRSGKVKKARTKVCQQEKRKKIENWTMTFSGKPIMTYEEAPFEETPPEYVVDTQTYGRDEYEEYINELKMRIADLKSYIRFLEGKCEAQEKFWKIWNGEREDEK